MSTRTTYLVLILPRLDPEAFGRFVEAVKELERTHGGRDGTIEPVLNSHREPSETSS